MWKRREGEELFETIKLRLAGREGVVMKTYINGEIGVIFSDGKHMAIDPDGFPCLEIWCEAKINREAAKVIKNYCVKHYPVTAGDGFTQFLDSMTV